MEAFLLWIIVTNVHDDQGSSFVDFQKNNIRIFESQDKQVRACYSSLYKFDLGGFVNWKVQAQYFGISIMSLVGRNKRKNQRNKSVFIRNSSWSYVFKWFCKRLEGALSKSRFERLKFYRRRVCFVSTIRWKIGKVDIAKVVVGNFIKGRIL